MSPNSFFRFGPDLRRILTMSVYPCPAAKVKAEFSPSPFLFISNSGILTSLSTISTFNKIVHLVHKYQLTTSIDTEKMGLEKKIMIRTEVETCHKNDFDFGAKT